MDLRRLGRRAGQGLVVAYPVSLGGVALLLHGVGEAHWTTTVGLYLPAVFYLAPLLPIALLALWLGPRSLLAAPGAGALIALFPLMGLSWSLPRLSADEERRLRVLSYNVDSVRAGTEAVAAGILEADPDLLLIQESDFGREELVQLLQSKYPVVELSNQFMLASRHPLVEVTPPERIPYGDRLRSPRFMRYLVATPLGKVAVYNVHPLSPRESLGALRGEGLRREIASGRIFRGESREIVEANTGLRVLQMEAIGRMIRAEKVPVIVAGDTNLPGPSPVLRRALGHLRDGFESVGSGFGYTFPTKWPFLRLDRILTTEELEFVRFTVGCGRASDHHCVVADLTGSN